MPHLTSFSGLRFSVEMKLGVRVLENGGEIRVAIDPSIPENIDHRDGPEKFGRPEWQATDSPNELLELGCDTCVDRVVA